MYLYMDFVDTLTSYGFSNKAPFNILAFTVCRVSMMPLKGSLTFSNFVDRYTRFLSQMPFEIHL